MTRYVRSRHLEVEQHVGEEVVYAHGLVGTRLRLNPSGQKLLSAFTRPRALEDLVSPASIDKVRPTFELLRARSFLVEEGRDENIGDRRLERLARGIFGCPLPARAPAVPDYTFLGIPFDHGNHGEPGARFGPAAIRDAAVELHLQDTPDPVTGRSAGWHDNDTDSVVLAGAALADEGNVYVAPGEAPARVFEKVRSAVADIRGRGSFPVVLGGDHSVTYPVLSAYEEPLAVFHLDAHSDLAPYHPGIENHHGNVMSRALGLPHVCAIYQVGLRGTTPVSQLRTDDEAPAGGFAGPDARAGDRGAARARPRHASVLRLGGHRRARPGARARHEHSGARRPRVRGSAGHPEGPGRRPPLYRVRPRRGEPPSRRQPRHRPRGAGADAGLPGRRLRAEEDEP